MSKLSFKLLLLIQIFQLFFAVSLILAPVPASAADAQFVPEVPLPVKPDATDRYNFGGGEINITNDKSTRPIAEYIKSIYKYGIGAVGIISAIVLMIGGAIWITAAGSSERITEAKSWILSSLTGLILAICSYTILLFINPNLVNFQIHKIQNVAGYKFCCDLSKGVSSIEKNGGSCPKNAVPYDNLTQECKISSTGKYTIIKKNNGCCQFTEHYLLYTYTYCRSDEKYTNKDKDCDIRSAIYNKVLTSVDFYPSAVCDNLLCRQY